MGVLLAGWAALAAGACGGSDERSGAAQDPGLRVERSAGPRGPELVVYVVRPALNVPATTGGAGRVSLRCFDSRRRRVVAPASFAWPFTDTDGGVVDPHVHRRLSRSQARKVTSCELAGTRPPLTARVTDASY